MKKTLICMLAAVLCAAMVIPAAAEVPTPWFELGYQDGQPVDLQGNLTVSIQAGEVIDTTVTYEGAEYSTVAFVGNEDQEGMLVELPFDETSYGEFLLSGCTYELFIELESLASGTSGFFSCVNGGGSSLYYRNGGDGKKQIQFQIGTTDNSAADNAWGAYAGAAKQDAGEGPVWLDPGRILHCVGTYNKETNMLSVYLDGVLASTGSYGDGEFNLGGGFEDVLGIGINPAYPSESYAVSGDEFRVVGARLYKTTLTEEQVAEEYANCIASLTGISAAPAEEVVEEAPVEEVVEEPVEEVVVEEPAAEEAPEEVVVEEPEVVEEAAPVVAAAPQTFDASLIAAAVAIISAAGYAVSKKH